MVKRNMLARLLQDELREDAAFKPSDTNKEVQAKFFYQFFELYNKIRSHDNQLREIKEKVRQDMESVYSLIMKLRDRRVELETALTPVAAEFHKAPNSDRKELFQPLLKYFRKRLWDVDVLLQKLLDQYEEEGRIYDGCDHNNETAMRVLDGVHNLIQSFESLSK